MKVFHCRCCGACCRWEGQVRYLPEEGRKIAEFLGISEEELIQGYTKLARDRRGLVFLEKEDGACIFLTEKNLCQIQPVKPLQCGSFPKEWSAPDEFMQQCQGYWSDV